jgi:hypothetical protein
MAIVLSSILVKKLFFMQKIRAIDVLLSENTSSRINNYGKKILSDILLRQFQGVLKKSEGERQI